ncbi:baseplate protein [Natrarchaeobius halalkaliphilus]|uniref:Baseplate protein n=1 Tax=Natrarchaeobius halalkaliphilus TaxID=1679091 RepID=A0A3N6LZ47_9EURY|nr:GPW/gp25 family protein [Natrarchaeobius halalkaliphilus]RQG88003.1 baseplate protein [Natrarchaeobius halalkaliphilus]
MVRDTHPEDPFPGSGWQFPVSTDHRGDIALSSDNESVEEAIRIIVGTAKGERVMRPEFGCDIHDHVFDSINGATMSLAEESVREALIAWEPRIDVRDVDASADPDHPNTLLITIRYVVRSTNSEGNMVYPFYINE